MFTQNYFSYITQRVNFLEKVLFFLFFFVVLLAMIYGITGIVYFHFPVGGEINLCIGVVCPFDPCSESECIPSTGKCAIKSYEAICCRSDSDCATISLNPCIIGTCGINNTCIFGPPLGGSCFGDSQCPDGEVCALSTCECIDLCDGVVCLQEECELRECDKFTGICELKAFLSNCCVTSSDCSILNSCVLPICNENKCGQVLAPNTTCVFDIDCPIGDSFCIGCMCSEVTGSCDSASSCPQGGNCTIPACSPGGCEIFTLPNCCISAIDCDDMNNCTTDSCIGGMCIFTELDQDMDNVACTSDCDDMDNMTGVPRIWYRDSDNDGRGTLSVTTLACFQPQGFVDNFLDCNDLFSPSIFSGAEACDLQNQAILFDQLASTSDSFFRGCGFSVSLFHNLTVRLCTDVRAFGMPQLEGGKIQMSEFFQDQGIWIDTGSFVFTQLMTNPQLNSVSLWETKIVMGIYNGADPNTFDLTGIIIILDYDFSTKLLTPIQTIGADLLPNFGAGDRFGFSVDIYNDTLIVGAPLYDNPAGDAGAVVIYRETFPLVWDLEQVIEAPSIFNNPQSFGFSVSIFEDRVIIGAPVSDNVMGSYASSFTRTAGIWTLEWIFPPGGGTTVSSIGIAVDNDDETVVLGSTSFLNSELATLFILDTSGILSQTFQRPSPSRTGVEDGYSSAVSVRGDIILVGCFECDGITRTSGAAFIYSRTNVTGLQWYFNKKEFPFDNSRLLNNRFGISVSADNTVFAIGSSEWSGDNVLILSRGAEYITICELQFVCEPIL